MFGILPGLIFGLSVVGTCTETSGIVHLLDDLLPFFLASTTLLVDEVSPLLFVNASRSISKVQGPHGESPRTGRVKPRICPAHKPTDSTCAAPRPLSRAWPAPRPLRWARPAGRHEVPLYDCTFWKSVFINVYKYQRNPC